MTIADSLASIPVSTLDLTRYVTLPADATVAETVRTMSSASRSAACIVAGDHLTGIFTQRDYLVRVVGRPHTWGRSITEEMSAPVRTMHTAQSVADGLAIMSEWWVRSVPVLDGEGRLAGNLSFYVVMDTIAGLLAERLEAPVAEPALREGLDFIDFTGIDTSPAVTIDLDDTADVAAHHMRARGIGSILVVDDRGRLAGVVTEFDLLTKVGCDRSDLDALVVKDIMTPDPVTLRARSPIGDAVREMAEHGFAHVPLMGESDRPVAVTSFRDVAAYVEANLAALA